jgi:hypothetical protein
MTKDDRDRHDAALDRALAALPEPGVDPLWSRATRLAAERRLQAARPLAAQLLWAALRVLALAR